MKSFNYTSSLKLFYPAAKDVIWKNANDFINENLSKAKVTKSIKKNVVWEYFC